jgi:phosphoribosylpyrophosphate synthetase
MEGILKNLDLKLNSLLELEDCTKLQMQASNTPSNQWAIVKSQHTTPKVTNIKDESADYHIIYYKTMETFVDDLIRKSRNAPKRMRFEKCPTQWGMFNDSTDNIRIQNMTTPTHFKGKNVIFVASFSDNAATMSQFHVIAYLCECLLSSLTVLLPFYSTGTMERVDIDDDGVVPTANTLALLFNGLPTVGIPIRIMTYDIHTLQNRFYFTGHALATLHTAIPLIKELIEADSDKITAVAFPDEGAFKRFGNLIMKCGLDKRDIIICSKQRIGDDKRVTISEGNQKGKHILIIDDQTKSGGTLIECAKVLTKHNNHVSTHPQNKTEVSVFVTHAICTDEFWHKFIPEPSTSKAPIDIFKKFYTTNSIPGLESYFETGVQRQLSYKKNETFYTPTANVSGETIKRKITILPLAGLVLQDL